MSDTTQLPAVHDRGSLLYHLTRGAAWAAAMFPISLFSRSVIGSNYTALSSTAAIVATLAAIALLSRHHAREFWTSPIAATARLRTNNTWLVTALPVTVACSPLAAVTAIGFATTTTATWALWGLWWIPGTIALISLGTARRNAVQLRDRSAAASATRRGPRAQEVWYAVPPVHGEVHDGDIKERPCIVLEDPAPGAPYVRCVTCTSQPRRDAVPIDTTGWPTTKDITYARVGRDDHVALATFRSRITTLDTATFNQVRRAAR